MIFEQHQPLILDKKIAKILGLNEAIVLEQVHYWIEKNKKAKRNFHEGRFWTYNTLEAWAEEFPFWSITTVKRIFKKLREENLLITGNFNLHPMDKTLWYAIDYEELERRLGESREEEKPQGENHAPKVPKKAHEEDQDESIERSKMDLAIPENSTEISADTLNLPIGHREIYRQEKDGPMDGREKSFEVFQEKYNKIIERCELHCIEESYREATAKAIKLLLLDIQRKKDIKISGNTIPAKIVEKDIHKIDFFVIQHAIMQFKEASAFERIRNTTAYFKSCIYNAIGEMSIDMEARLRYAQVIV